MKRFLGKQANIVLSNTLINNSQITITYIWLIYQGVYLLIDLTTFFSTIGNIKYDTIVYVSIESVNIFLCSILMLLYKRVGAKYIFIRELIGIVICLTQMIVLIEIIYILNTNSSLLMCSYSSLCFLITVSFYDTVATLLRALIYHVLIFAYIMYCLFFRDSRDRDFFPFYDVLSIILSIFFLAISGTYCLFTHRYHQLINYLAAENNSMIGNKLFNLSGLGISIECNTTIAYRNDNCKHYCDDSTLLSLSDEPFINTKTSLLQLFKKTMMYHGKLCTVSILHDVTSVSQQEKERYFKMLIATITHELRTPLNIIVAVFQYMYDIVENPVLKIEIKRGLCASSMQEMLINDILDSAKIENGNILLNTQPTNIKKVLDSVHELFSIKIKKEIQFSCKSSETIPDIVSIDERRFKQILLNLLSNSIKFTLNGFIAIEAKYSEGLLETSVIDSGAGIQDIEKPLIFKPFGTAVSTLSMNKSGTGLGLSLCKTLIEKMGGTISFSSLPGVKTEFKFTVKIQKANVQLRPALLEAIHKVVIIDDNLMNISVLENYCKKAGKDYTSYSSSEEVIKQISASLVKCIWLIDLRMPILDGFEIARTLKSNYNDAILYAVTGEDRQNVLQKCKDCGFIDVIEKPISYDSFLRIFK